MMPSSVVKMISPILSNASRPLRFELNEVRPVVHSSLIAVKNVANSQACAACYFSLLGVVQVVELSIERLVDFFQFVIEGKGVGVLDVAMLVIRGLYLRADVGQCEYCPEKQVFDDLTPLHIVSTVNTPLRIVNPVNVPR
jgi:hypothetical protein